MKVAAVVPMKLNSRRLPGKNIKSFTGGWPLCWYILSTLLEVEGIDQVYVYCSSPEIQDYLPEGFEIGQMRAEYKKSALLNDVLVPEAFAEEDRVGVSLCSETGEPYAIVEFRRKTRG